MVAGRPNEVKGTHQCRLFVTNPPVAQSLERLLTASSPVPFSPTLNYTISSVSGLANYACKSRIVDPRFIVGVNLGQLTIYLLLFSLQLTEKLKSGPPV